MDILLPSESEVFSTGWMVLVTGYLLGLCVWSWIAHVHKPGREVLARLPRSVRWTLCIPFLETWRGYVDAAGQAKMERYLVFSCCRLIYLSWGPLILLYLSIAGVYSQTVLP